MLDPRIALLFGDPGPSRSKLVPLSAERKHMLSNVLLDVRAGILRDVETTAVDL